MYANQPRGNSKVCLRQLRKTRSTQGKESRGNRNRPSRQQLPDLRHGLADLRRSLLRTFGLAAETLGGCEKVVKGLDLHCS